MKNDRTRTIGIIIAVILSLAALLYLGGLVCQLLTEYQLWLANGGMQGESQIGTIRFGPFSCWRYAFTLSGLKYTGFVALLGGGIYAFIRLHDRFGSPDFDDRNFARSQRGTYGTAGWMGEKELRAVLEVSTPQKARGIILGQNERGSVICLPEDTRLNKHIAVFGASGTMKSRGVIRPALFQSIRRGESVVVTDPKSEIYSDTVELFRKHGYTVRVYNLLNPELSDSWNCMFDLGGDTLMAQVLTDVIIANTKGDGKGDHFWDNGEGNLLKSLILYVNLDATRRPEERNLPAVYQMLTQNTEKQLTALFDRLPLRELSYQRWVDATAHYQPGQRVLVKVLEVDRSDRNHLQVAASVKQAGENPYEKALKKYAVGSLYVGTVSMVDTTGVFVSLDGGIDCLCTYPKRGRPPRGCRVSVRILGINYESNRIWGVITHMSTVR